MSYGPRSSHASPYHDSFLWQVGAHTYLLEVTSRGAYHHWQTLPHGWDNPHLVQATPADLGGFRPTGTLVVDVSQFSTAQKVGEAMHRSLKYVGEEARPILLSLISPETIGYAIALEAAYAVSMFFGVGEVLTAVLVVAGVYFVGSQVIEIVDSLVGFVKRSTAARTVADLEAAARLFAHGLTLSVDLVVSLLSRKLRGPGGTSRVLRAKAGGRKTPKLVLVCIQRHHPPLDHQPQLTQLMEQKRLALLFVTQL